MNNKIKNVIKIIIISVCVFVLIVSSIVSQDLYHLETCKEEHCIKCAMIQIAQTIIESIIAIVFYVFIGFLIYFFLSRLYNYVKIVIKNSLVFQKVQFNE